MLIPLAMLACTSPSPVVGEGATDGGSWWLSLEQTDFDQGEAEIALLVQTAGEGEPAPGPPGGRPSCGRRGRRLGRVGLAGHALNRCRRMDAALLKILG